MSHLNYIQRISLWDEAVMMPVGAGPSRSVAVATLNKLIQAQLTNKDIPDLIEQAKLENLTSEWDKANLALIEKKYIASKCITPELSAKFTQSILTSFQSWRLNRELNAWQDFLPALKNTFEISREIAEIKSQVLQMPVYDVLIDGFSPGLTQSRIDTVFGDLKEEILALRNQIIQKQSLEAKVALDLSLPIEKQHQLGLTIMHALNFNFNQGRLDVSDHPFCDGIPTDIRITTSYDEKNFISSLFGIVHEAGHALFEQGMPKEWIFQPVGQTRCKSLHESQSLLYEYEVGYSKAFIQYLARVLQNSNEASINIDADKIYQAITRVDTNLIRIKADEVSYPLHVMLRYEIEKALFSGEITIEDLPCAWDEKMREYFNISTSENYKDGVMQDMHWSWGYFGYFPSYTFGRLAASQFYSAFIRKTPEFHAETKVGNFSQLNEWLTREIYSFGSILSSDELLFKATGEPLNPHHFLSLIKSRYLTD